jgi:formylglycine-generating enzyme required for sulfatase activity
MSAFGAYNMAGNVAEWTANDSSTAFSRPEARGRSDYMFSLFGGRPASQFRQVGFRCARNPAEGAGDQGGMRIELEQEVPRTRAFTAGLREARERLSMRRHRSTRVSSKR